MFETAEPEVEARDLWGVRATVVMVGLVGLEFLVFDLVGLSMLFSNRGYRAAGVRYLFVCAALGVANWKTMTGLLRGRRYAAYLASLHGLCYLFFCGAVIYDLYHPERLIADEGFGLLMIPFLLPCGLWLLLYPHLPHVRRTFAAQHHVEC